MNASKTIMLVIGIAALIALAYFGIGAVEKGNMANADAGVTLETEKQKLGYTFGAQIGADIAQNGMIEEIDLDAFLAAIKELATGQEARMTEDEMTLAQQTFQNKRAADYQAMVAANKKAGEDYMLARKDSEGVTTTDSGLQYEILRAGKGGSPTTQDSVKVHYSGALTDGTIFDSSYERSEPATFPVTGVIPGFSEGLQLMTEGGKYRFVIPADKAYGEQAPATIGPNQVLVFEVELLEILNKGTEVQGRTDTPK